MLLLFDTRHQYLGEVSLSEDGSLKSLILTSKGEEEIGPNAVGWQTKGVPVKQRIRSSESESDQEPFFIERVQPRSPGFKQAFLTWTDEAKVAVIDIEDSLIGFWEALLRLPLSASERFTYLLAVCRTPKEKIKEWEKLFNQLTYDESSTESKRALNKLKVKLAKEMTNSFCEISDVSS